MLKKLRWKFVAVNMTIIVIMLLTIFLVVYQFTAADLEKDSVSALQTLTQSLQQPGPGEKMPQVTLPYFVLRINLRGDATAYGNTYLDLSDKELIQNLIQQVFTGEESTGYLEDYGLRYSRIGGMGQQAVAFVDVTGQDAVLSSLVKIGVLVGISSLAVFFLISILLANWAVKPVEKAWQQQNQFVSDASHELKTPLTVIMSNAELLQSPETDPESRSRFVESISVMSRQMRNLVEGMLELARADNGQIKKQFSNVNFTELVNDTLLPFEAVLFEHQLLLQTELTPDICVRGNADYLRQIVEILLDNAIKYASAGIVSVQLRKVGKGQCLLAVSNPGTPIPQKDLTRIFDRFYRADQARTRTGSFGLGLSIAKSIVAEHGGKIWAQSNETGNCFYVQIPTEGS